MARRRRRVLGTLAALLGIAYVFLFLIPATATGSWAIDMAEVRRLAQSMPGDKATEVRVERVVEFKVPNAFIRTGGGWSMHPMQVFSFQLVFPTHSAVIDTAMNDAGPLPGGKVDAASFDRVSKALGLADLIVVTHEHGDHLGGLIVQKNLPQLLKAAKLNREQISHPELAKPMVIPAGAFEGYQPLEYDKYVAVAPGVVLIRAAGHTPGSQIVYVQRADGTEYLFLGDVAWSPENVERIVERPPLIKYLGGEDRGQVMRQLEELHRLSVAEPKLHQVTGHDPTFVDGLVAARLLTEKFK